jgi:hypothetical protein
MQNSASNIEVGLVGGNTLTTLFLGVPSTMYAPQCMMYIPQCINNQNLYTMNNVLSQAILIDIVEFSNLINPKLIDITDVDEDYNYFMLLESENKVYKVLMSVF